jgi:hypothetical protein
MLPSHTRSSRNPASSPQATSLTTAFNLVLSRYPTPRLTVRPST